MDRYMARGMSRFQVFRQGVELGLPEAAIALDPGGGILHRLRRKATAVDAAIDFAAEQSGGFENAQVLGDGRLLQPKSDNNISNRPLSSGKVEQNLTTPGFSHCVEGVRSCARSSHVAEG